MSRFTYEYSRAAHHWIIVDWQEVDGGQPTGEVFTTPAGAYLRCAERNRAALEAQWNTRAHTQETTR